VQAGKEAMVDDCLFSNVRFDPENYYFLYIGELKSIGLSRYLKKVFDSSLNRPVKCIGVVPDLQTQYWHDTLIVPGFSRSVECLPHSPVSFRRKTSEFLQDVSHNASLLRLISTILTHQEQLYILMFESDPAMTLDRIEGVHLLGPDKELAKQLNNKATQFQLMDGKIPMVEFKICDTLPEVLSCADALRPRWNDGIFVSRVYSAAGAGSVITRKNDEITSFFSNDPGPFLLTRFLPHSHDPTVLGVVASKDEVYIAGVADQCIEGGNRFVGSTWPSSLAPELLEQLVDVTRRVGQEIGGLGYRGIFGCDFVVTEDNIPLFIEINARKQGTTLEFCHALTHILPPGSASLLELEYAAVLHGTFPANTVEPDVVVDAPLHWGTYNVKLSEQCRTTGFIPHDLYEEQLFSSVASRAITKSYCILDHVGQGLKVEQGTFLARIVAAGQSAEEVQQGLAQGQKMIAVTMEHME
jgi:hypothetical protein